VPPPLVEVSHLTDRRGAVVAGSALEMAWKRPAETRRKTLEREISLNLFEAASARRSGD
jgi:hypothetical protein